MTPKIKPVTNFKIKGLFLIIILSTLIPETVQAQFIPSIYITVPKPSITVPKPSITVPKPSITVPKPSITVPKPSITVPKPTSTFQLPANFVVNGAAGNTTPSFISVIQEGNNLPQIQTGVGSKSVAIPAATTTLSNINVVLPSGNTVSSGDVNFIVNTTLIPSLGSVINSVNLSFPVPALD
jgi:hypothetical protein